jgi:Helix-turn-helix
MPPSKSQQSILEAFVQQSRRKPDRTPTYTVSKTTGWGGAAGNRLWKAAEELVKTGLATVSKTESYSKGGRTTTLLTLSPAIMPEAPPPEAVPTRAEPKSPKKAQPKRAKPTRNAPHPWEKKLRTRLIGSKLSDNALSRQTGISQSILSRFRSGTRSLSFSNAARLAEALGFRFEVKK